MKRLRASNNSIEFCKNNFCVKATGSNAELLTGLFVLALIFISVRNSHS